MRVATPHAGHMFNGGTYMRSRWTTATIIGALALGALIAPQSAVAAVPAATVAPGAYSFTSVATSKQLDVAGVSVSAGAGVTHTPARGSAAQSWWVAQLEPGTYRISNVNSGLCMQDAGSAGGQLTQQACSTVPTQRWHLDAVDGGYELRSQASGRLADATAAPAITSRADVNSTAQRWVIAPNKLTRVSAWGTALTAGGPAFSEKTIRMVLQPTIAGNAQRMTFSNRFGSTPLTIGAASVGYQGSGLATTAAPTAIRFGGATSVTIAPGAEIISDPVNVPVTAGQNLTVSAYVKGNIANSSYHTRAHATTGIAAGNQTAASAATSFTSLATSYYFLKSIDVISNKAPGTMVALGDSITDGFGSTQNGFDSWPAQLGQKLVADGRSLGIVNAGISSNRLTLDSTASSLGRGMSAISRFDYDVASVPGVTAVYLFEGINDVGDGVTSPQLIAGYQAIIDKARAAGLKVYGASMTPFNGVAAYTTARETVRTTTNAWILSHPGYDGVLDFSAAVANPADPTRILPAYDSGDRIHLSAAGYEVLASQVAGLLP